MAELDLRVVKISIEINGKTQVFSDLQMTAVGTKYANPLQNMAEISIDNLDKTTQDYLLTETSIFNLNRTPKKITVEAGRQSWGTTKIYTGNIVSSRVTQPPDTRIILRCLTGNFYKGILIQQMQAGRASLLNIAKNAATSLNLSLDFQAQNKLINNYSFTGGAFAQVDAIGKLGSINAYVDNDTLVIKQANLPLSGTAKVISADTGMIGIPDITEQGLRVKYLIDNQTRLGGLLSVKSVIYPAVNGNYIIYKLSFDIASRDTPFYYIAEAKRLI